MGKLPHTETTVLLFAAKQMKRQNDIWQKFSRPLLKLRGKCLAVV